MLHVLLSSLSLQSCAWFIRPLHPVLLGRRCWISAAPRFVNSLYRPSKRKQNRIGDLLGSVGWSGFTCLPQPHVVYVGAENVRCRPGVEGAFLAEARRLPAQLRVGPIP